MLVCFPMSCCAALPAFFLMGIAKLLARSTAIPFLAELPMHGVGDSAWEKPLMPEAPGTVTAKRHPSN